MNRTFRYAAAALTALVVTTGAAGAVSFSRADLNHDGVVTWPEADRAFPRLTEVHFLKADNNGDGVVDKREFPILSNMYDMMYRNRN